MSDQDLEGIAKQREDQEEKERRLVRQMRRMRRLSEAAGHATWHAKRCQED